MAWTNVSLFVSIIFGAAGAVGDSLILGAAQTTAKAEETATENKTEAVASAPKMIR